MNWASVNRLQAWSLLAVLVVGGTGFNAAASADGEDPARGTVLGSITAAEELDPEAFFDRLVERYRRLTGYVEETEIDQETSDPVTEDPPLRIQSRVRAEIIEGRLLVERPGLADDAVRTIGGEQAMPDSGASDADLWLLPHMGLRFIDDVLREFQDGVEDGFTPVAAELLDTADDELVRLELRSGAAVGDPSEAVFELFVDPERMLVERLHGRQVLASGLEHRTIIRIEPLHVRGGLSNDVNSEAGEDGKPAGEESPQPKG